jgi:hypothetical protein
MARAKTGIGDLVPKAAPVAEMTYPISPDYIKNWSAERAIAEIIANAIDADPRGFSISYADGVLDISDGAALGIGAEGMVLGFSDKRDRDDQIGQFGEGLKIASLVLARDPSVGGVFIETVGYSVVPVVVDQKAIVGLSIPSKSAVPTKVLRWRLWPCDRVAGTRIRIVVPERVAKAAQARFLHITDQPYEVPTGSGRVITSGKAGRIYIGGVLVSERRDFALSYDLSLQASRTMQNRDRVVIDGAHLSEAVRKVLYECVSREVLEVLVARALAGKVSPAEAAIFSGYQMPAAQKRIFHEIGQSLFGGKLVFYMGRGVDEAEASIDLPVRGYTEVSVPKLEGYVADSLMSLLGVPTASSIVKNKVPVKRETVTWVADSDLTPAECLVRDQAVALMRSLFGSEAVARVHVYSKVEADRGECLGWDGFYENNGDGDICLRRDRLAGLKAASETMVHETAHRLAHRYPQSVGLAYPEWTDHSRGFEKALGNMLAMVALSHAVPVVASIEAPTAPRKPVCVVEVVPLDVAAATDARAADHGFVALPGFHFVPRGGWFDRACEPGMAFGELFTQVARERGLCGPTKRFTFAGYSRVNFVRSWLVRNISKGLIPYQKSFRDIAEVLEPAGLSAAAAWLAGYLPGHLYNRCYTYKGEPATRG